MTLKNDFSTAPENVEDVEWVKKSKSLKVFLSSRNMIIIIAFIFFRNENVVFMIMNVSVPTLTNEAVSIGETTFRWSTARQGELGALI